MLRETSREALDRAPNRYEQVKALLASGPKTDWEIHKLLDCPYSSVQRPRGELEAEGFIRDSGERRETGYGRSAIVWVLV